MVLAPSILFSESMPLPDSAISGSDGSGQYSDRINTNLNFAAGANGTIKGSPDHTAGGASIVDPDSVLDDSGRIYNGYKDGTYFLPIDAVRVIVRLI